jgi:hypothetical protein
MATANLRTDSKSSLFAQAAIAGVLGGIIVDLFLAIVTHHSPIALWQFIASTIVGQVAFTSSSYALLGFIVHFIVSIVWAVLYAYVFGALGQLKNWILGAIVWGVVVDAAMQLLLQIKIGAPFGTGFINGLLPHIVFYALPVALYMARGARVEPRSA